LEVGAEEIAMSEANPRQSDAILGGQTPPPVTGAILGGLAGAKQRLESETLLARRVALTEALKYGEHGIELAIQALRDPDEEIQRLAGRLLRHQAGEQGKQALLEHKPLSYFTTLNDWRFENYNVQVGITDPENNAYTVRMTNTGDFRQGQSFFDRYDLSQFKSLVKDPRVEELQALVFQIDYNYWDESHTFGFALEALLEAKAAFPNLKALFMGDSEGHRAPEFRKSKLRIFDIGPLLTAFPKLEVLQVFGFFGDSSGYTLECESLRHESLKSLIIETSDITGPNIEQLCSMDLPNLEYFELWFGRNYEYGSEAVMLALSPILLGEVYANIKYLGLCSSEDFRTLLPAIISTPIINQLAVLDLKMGTLTDNLARKFNNLPEAANLKVLNVTGNELSEQAISELSRHAAQVISSYQFENNNDYQSYDEDDESDAERRMNRHSALYE
jgi:hypothetical protein